MAERVKTRAVFVCSECGNESMKWQGRCPECQAWNTLAEKVVSVRPTPAMGRARANGPAAAPVRVSELAGEAYPRIEVGISEFDRVLGGGIVPGSLVLIGGDPGIGKCLTGSTRVLDPATGDFLPITAWADGSRSVLSLDHDTRRLVAQPVAAYWDNGVRPVVEVTTRLGRVMRCTGSHPVLTPDGWRPVDTLPAGTRIASPRELPCFGCDAMPEHEVRLIAYALSDGSASSQITVTSALPEVADDLACLAQRFGMELRVYPKPKTSARQYRLVQPHGRRAEERMTIAAALKRVQAFAGISWAEWARRAQTSYDLLNVWRRATAVPGRAELERLAAVAGVPVADLAADARDRAAMKTPAASLLETAGLRFTKARTKAVPGCIFRLPREQLALFLKILFSCDGSLYVNQAGVSGLSYSTIRGTDDYCGRTQTGTGVCRDFVG
jgi:replicative DNA helicase